MAYVEKKNYPMALKHFFGSYELGKKLGSRDRLIDVYANIHLTYSLMKDFEKAYNFQRLYTETKDTIFSEENNRQMAEMQTRFETEKKDKELLKKDAEKKQLMADAKQKSTERNAFIAGFILMIGLAFFIFRSYRQKKAANELLTDKNLIIEKQKHMVEEKQKEILDSIHYAQRIQKALITNEKNIDRILKKLKKDS
jgi:hypothetical protein